MRRSPVCAHGSTMRPPAERAQDGAVGVGIEKRDQELDRAGHVI
jgi:hypothetical protein